MRAWIVLDCDWKTIRDIAFTKKSLMKPDCKKCTVYEVEIRQIKKKSKKR